MSPSERKRDRALVRRGLGGNISRRSRELGISRVDCAMRAGVSVSAVAALERGERQPLVSTLLMMAAALDWTPTEILDGVCRPDPRRCAEAHDPHPDAG